MPLDATKELTGLTMTGISPLVPEVNVKTPIHSIKDLSPTPKRNGTMNFGSGGVGTTPHMAGELLAFDAGIDIVHVAYRGEAPGINDLLGGQIPFISPTSRGASDTSRPASCARSASPTPSACLASGRAAVAETFRALSRELVRDCRRRKGYRATP